MTAGFSPSHSSGAASGGSGDPADLLRQLERGVEGLYSPQQLKQKLASGRPLRVKLGMDPTAPDLHLGHTVVLRKLRQFQDLGHLAVLIIGDYTARIGDPTGRDSTRPVLGDEQIHANAETYLEQAGRILDTSEAKLELRYNSSWLSELSFADVLRLTGMITVQQMLHRENFRRRLEAEREIMISEFMYPLMQAYDSVAVRADVELGGTDQTFNNLMGRELMEKSGLEKQVVMTLPILVGLDGREKMSKSKGNTVAVEESPDEMFGKLMSMPDELMDNYFRLLTSTPEAEIAALIDPGSTHPRQAKDRLGRMIVEQFHGQAAAEAASEEFTRRFSEKQVPSDLEAVAAPESPVGVLKLVRSVGFAASHSEARRLVEQGAVSLDDEKITDPKAQLTVSEPAVLRVGKRRICRVDPPR